MARTREELEDTILDLLGRLELSPDDVEELYRAEDELEAIEQEEAKSNANSK